MISTKTKNTLFKIAGICGLLSPILMFLLMTISISNSPWFSWTHNFLSDLAGMPGETPIWSAYGTPSIIFNIGLILGGFLGLIFAVGLIKSRILSNCLCKTGSLFLLIDMVTLFLIGLFPKTLGDIHTLVSYIFFLFVPLYLLFLGIKLRKTSEKILGFIAIILGLSAILSFLIFPTPQPYGSNAIVEMVSLIAISAFSVIFSIRLIKQTPEPTR